MSVNCEEHNHSPILTEGRSNPLKEMAKEHIKLLSDEKIAVHAASESVRILCITYVFN